MTPEPETPTSESPREPTVLDYLKSRLSFGRGRRIEIPAPAFEKVEAQPAPPEPSSADSRAVSAAPSPSMGLTAASGTGPQAAAIGQPSFAGTVSPVASSASAAAAVATFPWRSLLALALALLAQNFYEPPHPSVTAGTALYVAALALAAWAALRGEWLLAPLRESSTGVDPLTFRRSAFLLSLPFAVLAFLFFSGNKFTLFNVALWLIALVLFVSSLWLKTPGGPSVWQRLRDFITRSAWQIRIDRWTLLVLVVAGIVLFFRVYNLQQTPGEPFSDHAEKLLDVYDVSQGQTHIFFPRNTGREAIVMYWSLLTSWVFGTGLSFMTLKLATVTMGLFTMPFVYLLGKEVANRRVALLAVLLMGIAYWPNVISRVGLRFALYTLFTAPMMYYLIRGLRTRNRNDIILAGIFLGLGLHGYSPYRIVPFLVVAAIILYVLHAQSKGVRATAWSWLVIIGLTSMMIFLPLLRYATENPEMYSYRAITRLGTVEQPLSAPWYTILASNTWNGLRMFNLNDGVIWVHSVPLRPALDVISGALFLIGVALLLVRWFRKRHWLDLFILVSIPILLLPSILSLAFPGENPSLNRTAAAAVPVFLVVALALDGLITALGSIDKRKIFAYGLTLILLWASAAQNYDLVFNQYDQGFRDNAWNSSDMGAIIKEFGLIYGETDSAWVIPFPYWVDTRLVGVWAGIPTRDFALAPDHLSDSLTVTGPKLFIAKASTADPGQNDQKSVDALKQLYPQGSLSLHHSPVPGRDFWVFFVPGSTTQ